MKVLLGSWFELPRLGKDAFALLMKQGVKYEKGMGFKLDHDTDIESAVRTLSSAIGEDVELTLRCLVCGVEACPDCPYADVCDRSKVSPFCLCGKHASGRDAYETYRRTFMENLNA